MVSVVVFRSTRFPNVTKRWAYRAALADTAIGALVQEAFNRARGESGLSGLPTEVELQLDFKEDELSAVLHVLETGTVEGAPLPPTATCAWLRTALDKYGVKGDVTARLLNPAALGNAPITKDGIRLYNEALAANVAQRIRDQLTLDLTALGDFALFLVTTSPELAPAHQDRPMAVQAAWDDAIRAGYDDWEESEQDIEPRLKRLRRRREQLQEPPSDSVGDLCVYRMPGRAPIQTAESREAWEDEGGSGEFFTARPWLCWAVNCHGAEVQVDVLAGCISSHLAEAVAAELNRDRQAAYLADVIKLPLYRPP
ncbi:hypothetical protein HYH03_012903 [Edaphochlamys debaryana]|uniref:Uncharacterized protein n=1 Tax=Edaphochlamys debaryana TaxID=47281 RepID=A0A835XZR8_9CHLO|nr:hypothetical protein HYH03_012903 [Edaphochlamys debaryana]|eukprot:KAG2488584.1 hypothetical protein HYH03_012903 [Edaphochlamys debaryana]